MASAARILPSTRHSIWPGEWPRRAGARIAWLGTGAVALGTGIWAMHFGAMLAFYLPISIPMISSSSLLP